MTLAGLLGVAAVLLTTAGWFPQVNKALKSRSAQDFSPAWFALFGSGITCWLGYGILKGDVAIMVANGLALVAIAIIASVHRGSRLENAVEPEG